MTRACILSVFCRSGGEGKGEWEKAGEDLGRTQASTEEPSQSVQEPEGEPAPSTAVNRGWEDLEAFGRTLGAELASQLLTTSGQEQVRCEQSSRSAFLEGCPNSKAFYNSGRRCYGKGAG